MGWGGVGSFMQIIYAIKGTLNLEDLWTFDINRILARGNLESTSIASGIEIFTAVHFQREL